MKETNVEQLSAKELKAIIKRFHEVGGMLDLSRYHLTDVNLDNYELLETHAQLSKFSNCSFVKSKMMGSVFDNSYVKTANFSGANLVKSEFHSCDFSGSNFTHAELIRVLIMETNLSGADFSYANLSFASFIDCNLSGVRFDNANLEGCEFKGCSIDNASWIGVEPPKTIN